MARIGSFCSGAGMLDRAVESLFGAAVAWHAETDPAASRVLARHWPDVPNIGDITAVDWSKVGPVDLLCGGIPCQLWSTAGLRRGSDDERDLWPVRKTDKDGRLRRGAVDAIRALRPPVFVLENVPALLTGERGVPFGTILADLNELGYTTAWTTVGACRVGACHHRHRLFVLAVRSDAVAVPSGEPVAHLVGDVWLPVQDVLFGDAEAVRWPASGVSRNGLVWPLLVETCGADSAVLPTPTARIADKRGTPSPVTAADRMAAGRRNLEDAVALLPTPRVSAVRTGRSAIIGSASSPSLEQAMEIARGELPRELRSWEEAPPAWLPLPTPTARDASRGAGWGERPGRPLSEVAALLSTPRTTDVRGAGRHGDGGPDLRTAVTKLLPTPRASDTGTPGRRASEGWRPPLSQVLLASDARGVGSSEPTPRASDASKGGPNQRGSSGDLMLPSAVQPGRFGVYEAAVVRQEHAFGVPAPDPTEPGRLGKPRLAAPFCEWMMGLPPGWITDVVPRGDAIRIAGNGVVGQAVVHALPLLPTWAAALALLDRESLAVAS